MERGNRRLNSSGVSSLLTSAPGVAQVHVQLAGAVGLCPPTLLARGALGLHALRPSQHLLGFVIFASACSSRYSRRLILGLGCSPCAPPYVLGDVALGWRRDRSIRLDVPLLLLAGHVLEPVK
jgi:hypothetical protein